MSENFEQSAEMNNYQKLLEQREKLPVYQYKKQFLDDLESNQCVLLIGETGSGKTTQVPQWCCDYLMRKNPEKPLRVVCTQPRRVAAINVAQRVANEMNVELGSTVGYSIRFNNHTSRSTKLKFVTDGLLLRNLMENPLFEGYGVVILDEVHERSLSTDILLGFVKRAINLRDNLKLIIMSATIDANLFVKYFQEYSLAVLNIPGRAFPVEIVYEDHEVLNYLEYVKEKVMKIHTSEPKGDILVFLTGEQEIESTCASIRAAASREQEMYGKLNVIPLYSLLSHHEQQQVFEPTPPNTRKCIVATNIAETSITIDGVVYVIDSGYSKEKIYASDRSIEVYKIKPISKSSADQRAGRAGRTSKGKCYRLYSKEFYDELDGHRTPEILKCNLCSLVLSMIGLKANCVHFDYLTEPKKKTLIDALDLLYAMGAIDLEGNLTAKGQKINDFPIEPTLANMLISSGKYNCCQEMLLLVSMLSVQPVFVRPLAVKCEAEKKHAMFYHSDGEHLTLINVLREFIENNQDSQWCYTNFLHCRFLKQAVRIKVQLENIMRNLNLPFSSSCQHMPDYSVRVRKCVLEGSFAQVVGKYEPDNRYANPKSGIRDIKICSFIDFVRNSAPQWVVYQEFAHVNHKIVRIVSPIELDWLFEIAPHYYNRKTFVSDYYKAALFYQVNCNEYEIDDSSFLRAGYKIYKHWSEYRFGSQVSNDHKEEV